MIVIGDACTVNFLLRANVYQDVYKHFGKIIVPERVMKELEGTPPDLEFQMIMFPLEVLKVNNVIDIQLDAGETEAIALYKQIDADLLLTDDKKAYEYCKHNNINVNNFVEVLLQLGDKLNIDLVKEIILNDTIHKSFTLDIFNSFVRFNK